ncbi:MAG: hypothetical protein M0P26_00465 [Bacteroidales bacterium]|nr:hypothetical protein [Bacteroidales bacterium]
MQHITSTLSLREAIQQLEVEIEFEGLQVKKDFKFACKSLNPFNMISDILEKAASPLLLFDKIVDTTLGLVTIYLAKKLIIGKSGNKFRLLAGSVLQFIFLNIIAQHMDGLKSFGRHLVQTLLKRINYKSRD